MNITFGIKKGLAGFGLFLLFALTSCNKKDIPFGENFLESFTDIVIIDTLTPAISTYKLDSFSTSGTGTLLLGSYDDRQFGLIKSSSNFRIGLPAFTIGTNDLYDSLTFILSPNNEYYGDTTVTQEIKVHELTQTLELPSGKAQFYNNTPAFAFNPVELGKRQVLPRPSRKDSVEIRLSDVKGAELFQKLKDKSNDVLNQDNFLRYFKGIHLTATPASAAIIGYKAADTTLKMRLYYREKGIALTSRYIDFPVANTNLQYNEVSIDRSGTPLQNLPAGFPTVPSASLGNATYIQYSTGLLGKITFPSLQNLLNIDKSGKILRAELTIKPLPGSFQDPFRLPPVLNLSVTDRTNALGPVQATANLVTDYLSGEKTGYTFDITPYLQNQIMVNEANRQGLFVYAPSISAFNRLKIGDATTGKSKIQVKIYYLVIK